MKVNLKLTKVGMNMQEGTITKWHKQPGESFEEGDIIYEFETEKVSEEVTATANGKLVEIKVPEGEDAEVGEVVCVVDIEQ